MNESVSQVYVVDDDLSVREAVGRLISSSGLKVEAFASAQELLRNWPSEAVSCLVLDVQLPGISGLDLQQELRRRDAQIPIVFMTGYGDIPMSVRAMKAGAIEFLTKPFRDEDLLNAVNQAIERGRQLDESKHQPPERLSSLEGELPKNVGFSEIVG